jgi:UDP-glucose 4-epimerase
MAVDPEKVMRQGPGRRRVLVTGGAGFIGGYVVETLVAQGHEPVIYDIAAEPYRDVRDSLDLRDAVREVDGVIHLAAILGTSETIADPYVTANTNVLGSINVFEACVERDIPFVNICTGNRWMAPLGGGAYPITKACAEDLARMYRDHRGAWVNQVRPVNAAGPRQSVWKGLGGTSRVRKIIPTFINQALRGQNIEIYGDGEQISDVVYVGDVAKLLVSALWDASKGRLHPLAEIGPDEHLTVNQIAEWVAAEVFRQTGQPSFIQYAEMRPGERKGVTQADTTTLVPYNCLPLTPISKWLPETVAYYARALYS